MGKKVSRKKLMIILIIIGILVVVAIATYFIVVNKNLVFSFVSPDFSSGAGAMDKAAGAGNSNAFENTKLNPFEDSS